MRKVIKIFILLFASLSFSSCIELVEEIKINPDLSGEYHLYIEQNNLTRLLNSLSDNIDLSELQTRLQVLKQQEGISQLITDIHPKKSRFSIRFHFSDAKSLTKAFYASLGAKKQCYNKAFLKVNSRRIKRPNLTPYLVKYAKSKDLKLTNQSHKILDYLDYSYRITSSKKIKSAFPPSSEQNQRHYIRRYTVNDLLINEQSTKSVIRLEN
ncbi:MAG: hypothetical protein JW857_11670 [Bacteroidales bacterium]|nr:hypothetical protein [Bacteroidales bacterium]